MCICVTCVLNTTLESQCNLCSPAFNGRMRTPAHERRTPGDIDWLQSIRGMTTLHYCFNATTLLHCCSRVYSGQFCAFYHCSVVMLEWGDSPSTHPLGLSLASPCNLYSSVLFCSVLYSRALFSIVLFYTMLVCTLCIVVFCIVLTLLYLDSVVKN